MIEIGKQSYLLFDGDCGICTSFAETVRGLDVQRKFRIDPYQIFPEEELKRYGIGYADCARKLRVLTPAGSVHSGAFAVNYFFFQYFPWTILVVLIYAVPILLIFEIMGYALVAKNRHRISRWFGMKACLRRDETEEKP